MAAFPISGFIGAATNPQPWAIALVGGAGLALRAAGNDVPAFGLTMPVLAAALPSAINVSLRAKRYGAGNGRVTSIITTSAVLTFASFTLIARLVHP